VLNSAPRDRLSFSFFFDPNFDADVRSIENLAGEAVRDDQAQRWGRASMASAVCS
jgi:isopenicillin N synthase-like dioxygenase